MKRFFIITIKYALLIITNISLLYAANPLCGITESLEKLNRRLFESGVTLGNKLDGLISNSTKIKSHTRFKNQSGLPPAAVAILEIELSLGAAENVAPNVIGDKTANIWLEIETSDGVVDAENVSYVNQGAGLGHIVKDSGFNDDEIEDLLRQVHTKCLPNTPILKKINVTTAHVTDSVRVMREAKVALPAKYWGSGGLRSTEIGTSSGVVAELLIMGDATRAGKKISGVDIDINDPKYADTKIDYFEDDDRMVQVGLTLKTVTDKWNSLNQQNLIEFGQAIGGLTPKNRTVAN